MGSYRIGTYISSGGTLNIYGGSVVKVSNYGTINNFGGSAVGVNNYGTINNFGGSVSGGSAEGILRNITYTEGTGGTIQRTIKSDNVTLTAKPQPGYRFVRWDSTGTDGEASGDQYIMTTSGTYNVTAVFAVAKTVIDRVSVSVNPPVPGDALQGTVANGTGYTAEILWNPTVQKADYNTSYTATVTLVPISNHEFAENITVEDWTVQMNNDGSLKLTRIFNTDKAVIEAVAVSVATPVPGDAPQTTVTGGTGYSAAICWNPAVDKFDFNRSYTATVTLTPDSNHKFAENINVQGWDVSENNDGSLTLTRTFPTRLEKLERVEAPDNKTLEEYHTTAVSAAKELPQNVTYTTESGTTISAAVVWSCSNYDSAVGAANTFTWKVTGTELNGYDKNGVATTGTVTVTNMSALAVRNEGKNAEITYDGSTYDVVAMFIRDPNAGEPTYTIVTGGTGAGTLVGSVLTISKAGTIMIRMDTAASERYAAGYAEATLTVKKGAGSGSVSIQGWTYGDTAKEPIPAEGKPGATISYLYTGNEYESETAPTRAGDYTVTATFAATELYEKATASAAFTISKREVTPSVSGEVSKAYDGTAEIPAGHGLSIVLVNVVEGDTVKASASYVFDSAAVDTRTVTASGITLSGEDSGNYQLAATTASAEVGRITKQQFDVFHIQWNIPTDLVYNGQEQTVSLTGTLPEGVEVTVSGNVATDAGEYTATAVFSLKDGFSADSYEIINDADRTAEWRIAKKNISDATVTLGEPLTYNGQLQTQSVAAVTVDGLNVTYTVSGNQQTNAGEYSLTVTGNGNFEDAAIKIWSIAKKNISDATVTLGEPLTYNGQPQTKNVVSVIVDGLEATFDVEDNVQTDAGEYSLTVTGTGNFQDNKTVVWSIAKANYNMSGVQWDYTTPFAYDGVEKTVTVTGLPSGVTATYTGNKATVTGEYTAKAILSYDAVNYNKPTVDALTWEIENNWTPTEYMAMLHNDYGWLNTDFVVTPAAGYKISTTNTAEGTWTDKLTRSEETAGGEITFYLKDSTNNTISLAGTATYKLDKTPPRGSVELVERTKLQKAVNAITFDLFYKNEVTVIVTSADDLSEVANSGVATVKYYASDKAMSQTEVEAIAENKWEDYTGGVSVTLEDKKQFVYFARITDKAGNVYYCSTNGAEYDTTAPVISGIENGRTYYTTQTATVTEKNPDTLTLNGAAAASPITLAGNMDADYTIVAVDKAGNETSVTVNMLPIASLSVSIDSLDTGNVTSDNETAASAVLAAVNQVLDHDAMTEEEKAELEAIQKKAQDLLNRIEDAAEAVATEDIRKVEDKDETNVRLEDKADLIKAKEALEEALNDTYKGNYTEEEKAAVQEEIDRLTKAIEIIQQTEAVINAIHVLPDSVEPDLEEELEKAIRDTKAAFDKLNEHQKSLMKKEDKEKLEQLYASLTAYKIVKGSAQKWEKGSSKNLVFTANGPDRKFKELRIDDKVVAVSNYTHADGSTIITLKASYLQTLSVGKHTIQVVYTDGQTDGDDYFRINNSGDNPVTGDNTNMIFFTGMALTSLLGLTMMILFVPRKKGKYQR